MRLTSTGKRSNNHESRFSDVYNCLRFLAWERIEEILEDQIGRKLGWYTGLSIIYCTKSVELRRKGCINEFLDMNVDIDKSMMILVSWSASLYELESLPLFISKIKISIIQVTWDVMIFNLLSFLAQFTENVGLSIKNKLYNSDKLIVSVNFKKISWKVIDCCLPHESSWFHDFKYLIFAWLIQLEISDIF